MSFETRASSRGTTRGGGLTTREETTCLADDDLLSKTNSADRCVYIYIHTYKEKKIKRIPSTEEYTRDDEKRLQFFEVYDET